MRHRIIFPLISIFLILLLVACAPEPPPLPYAAWEYSHLRLLDEAEAASPTLDLLALYIRTSGDQVHLRLDLLDHAPLPDYDLYLALDTGPDGATELPLEATSELEWDTLLVVPASGPVQSLDADLKPIQGGGLLVLRDPVLDTVSLSIKKEALFGPGGGRMGFSSQAFLAPAGSSVPADQLGPVHSQAPTPPPANVLFAFRNSYPAYTPLTALRRWDGAHTGPLGGRHGLYNLLRTARASGTPIILLDLKIPAWLSALDYGGNREIVDEMLASGQLLAPETLPDVSYSPLSPPDWAAEVILAQNRETARQFGLPPSPFLYSPSRLVPIKTGARLTFTHLETPGDEAQIYQPVSLYRWRDQRLLPIPDTGDPATQATLEGPSLELRRALVETALATSQENPQEAPILVLGGDLPASAWGDPLLARRTFRYLAAHPWVRPLNTHDLLSLPSKPYSLTPQPSLPELSNELLTSLQEAPPNPLALAAWQAYAALFAPLSSRSPDLPLLRANYLGGIWSLLEAAEWAERPTSIATCDRDADRDGEPECILASQRFYAQFEIESSALTHAFALASQGSGGAGSPHQLVAPSSQFISGLSDPLFWDLEAGATSDPSVIPGAFWEKDMTYSASVEGDTLVFISADGGVRKSFHLIPGGLQAEYRFSSRPPFAHVRIPLALDPWRRFSSSWADAYRGAPLSQGWVWELYKEDWLEPRVQQPVAARETGFRDSPLEPNLQVRIRSTGALSSHTFKDSRPFFSRPENPNKDYPPGHALPFPLALVEIPLEGDLSVEIEVLANP